MTAWPMHNQHNTVIMHMDKFINACGGVEFGDSSDFKLNCRLRLWLRLSPAQRQFKFLQGPQTGSDFMVLYLLQTDCLISEQDVLPVCDSGFLLQNTYNIKIIGIFMQKILLIKGTNIILAETNCPASYFRTMIVQVAAALTLIVQLIEGRCKKSGRK